MNSENIFDIWRFLGKGTPFVVRRNGWYHLSYMVTRVKPKGHYGEAYGYRLTDGKPENGITEEQVIDCCGCGNWELIENLIEDVDNLKWSCLDESNNLTFGKYKGMNVDEVKSKDEDYFKWALGYVGGLQELLFSRKYNISLQELLNTKKQIKEHLSFSSDDWIKSSVKSNFDFFLDQYKYSICAKQKDIKLAIKDYNQQEYETKYIHSNIFIAFNRM